MSPKNILVLTSIFILVGCGGGSGTSTPTVASFELLDPNAAANNRFGDTTVILANGNIVVVNPYDDTAASNAGAVHLFNPFTKTVVASFYGDDADDNIGLIITLGGVVRLFWHHRTCEQQLCDCLTL